MTKYKTLDEFFAGLTEPRKEQVEYLRTLILGLHADMHEQFKWNAPSYYLHHDDRITFNMAKPDVVRIVLHAGAKTPEDKSAKPIFEDTTGLLDWNSNIRATMTFESLEQIKTREADIIAVMSKWLALFD